MMNTTIATLTFHRANNYGAILQCYALQAALLSMGAQTEVLDYTNPNTDGFKRVRPKSLKNTAGQLLMHHDKSQRKAKFEKFISDRLVLTEKLNHDELSRSCGDYHSVIVGSDQVWNTELTASDMTYFGNFVAPTSKKCAYAASLGITRFPQEDEEECLEALGSFDLISVREKSAIDYLESLLNREIVHVCDPVLLLAGDVWGMISKSPNRKRKYVLAYSVGGAEASCISFASQLARSRDAELVVIHRSPHRVRGAINVRDAGPEEFLGWVQEADAVVTESFHGCCFSVIFRKDFYFVPAARLLNKQSRINDLLAMLGLTDRIVSNSNEMLDAIDFHRVEQKLAPFIMSSRSFLKDCLE